MRGRQTERAPMPVAAVTARAIKVTIVLDPAQLAEALAPFEQASGRVPLEITVDGRTLRADFAAKAVRKALGAVREHGHAGVAVLVQGKRMADNSIAEAGLLAQPRGPKAADAA